MNRYNETVPDWAKAELELMQTKAGFNRPLSLLWVPKSGKQDSPTKGGVMFRDTRATIWILAGKSETEASHVLGELFTRLVQDPDNPKPLRAGQY